MIWKGHYLKICSVGAGASPEMSAAWSLVSCHFQGSSQVICSDSYYDCTAITDQTCPFSFPGLISSSTDSSFGSWKSSISRLAPASLSAFPGFLVVRPTTGTPAATPARIPDAESLTSQQPANEHNVIENFSEIFLFRNKKNKCVYFEYEGVVR